MKKEVWFVLLFCLLLVMGRMHAADFIPAKMKFNIMQPIDDKWTTVTIRNHAFIYEEGHWEVSGRKSVPKTDLRQVFHPSPQQWLEFESALKEARVERWSTNYANPGVYDGTLWSLKLEINGHEISSGGDNNYPADGHEGWASDAPAPSRAFQIFLDGITKATGHKVQSFGSMTGKS